MPHNIPLAILIIFVSAKVMAEIAERLNQPGIVGEIFAGVIVGPGMLGWLSPDEFLSAMSDLGAMFLLFRVGLEVKSSELIRVGGTALMVATVGVIVPFAMGTAIMMFAGAGTHEAIFVGAALVATSVGITAQVLSAKGLPLPMQEAVAIDHVPSGGDAKTAPPTADVSPASSASPPRWLCPGKGCSSGHRTSSGGRRRPSTGRASSP